MPAAVHEFSDGEQLAVLECEGDYPRSASSVPTGGGDCGGWCTDCFVFGVHADHHCDGVPGVGRGSAAGVFVEQGAAALHGCESGITGQLYGVSTYIERRGTGAKRKTIWKKYRHYEQTAGPFDRLRAGSSTAPLAMRLRGRFDYAQGQDDNFYSKSQFLYRSII